MKPRAITEAKDPDLRAASTALLRAAAQARQTAIQTDTNLVIVKDGKLMRIPAQTLRATALRSSRKSA